MENNSKQTGFYSYDDKGKLKRVKKCMTELTETEEIDAYEKDKNGNNKMNEKLIKFLNEKIAEIEKEYSIKGIEYEKMEQYLWSMNSTLPNNKMVDGYLEGYYENRNALLNDIFRGTIKALYGYTYEQVRKIYDIYVYQYVIKLAEKYEKVLPTNDMFYDFYVYDKVGNIYRIYREWFVQICIIKQQKNGYWYKQALELRERIAEDEFM